MKKAGFVHSLFPMKQSTILMTNIHVVVDLQTLIFSPGDLIYINRNHSENRTFFKNLFYFLS
jgi:hypothetical protein